jgi:2-keto-4-pentenoate hydratase/2-oxohepta-3-ene-1,7-dioic acid hydratase in catechol pathway
MKLIRYGEAGKEKPAVMVRNQRYDLSAFCEDFNEDFFRSDGIAGLRQYLQKNASLLKTIPEHVRLGPPVARPSKIICIGMNYSDHARETGAPVPDEPILFFKSSTALAGPQDDVMIPRNSNKTDWEVELAVVIGKEASYIEEADAFDHIAGYCLHNDYSERTFQLERGGQWVKGKSCDSFGPLGPFLATPDEIPDVHRLRLWLTVNGRIMQDGNTSNLIFGVPFLVHYISQFMRLLPGDILSTGTPAGVGLGIKPSPVFLKPGDVVELGIEGLGASRQRIVGFGNSRISD